MTEVRVTEQAKADLRSIFRYLEERNPTAAKRVSEQIAKTFELLAEHPYAGSDRSALSSGLRGLAVGNYVVFYRTYDDVVSVVRVLHGARDIVKLFASDRPD